MTIDDGIATTPTRRRILDAGFRMWVDEPPEVLFAGFTVSRVAKAAGVTRATFYSYWPSTDAYLQDMLEHLRDHRPDGYGQAVADAAGKVGTAGADVVTQLLAACDREFAIIRADPALRVRLAFLSQMDDPRVAEQLRARYRSLRGAQGRRLQQGDRGMGSGATSATRPRDHAGRLPDARRRHGGAEPHRPRGDAGAGLRPRRAGPGHDAHPAHRRHPRPSPDDRPDQHVAGHGPPPQGPAARRSAARDTDARPVDRPRRRPDRPTAARHDGLVRSSPSARSRRSWGSPTRCSCAPSAPSPAWP